MPAALVVDSGPLVALFDRDDLHHRRAVTWLKALNRRLVTNLAVLTEVAHLLDFSRQTQIDFVRWIARGGVVLAELRSVRLPLRCSTFNALTQRHLPLRRLGLTRLRS